MSSDSEDCTAVSKRFHTWAAVELNARPPMVTCSVRGTSSLVDDDYLFYQKETFCLWNGEHLGRTILLAISSAKTSHIIVILSEWTKKHNWQSKRPRHGNSHNWQLTNYMHRRLESQWTTAIKTTVTAAMTERQQRDDNRLLPLQPFYTPTINAVSASVSTSVSTSVT